MSIVVIQGSPFKHALSENELKSALQRIEDARAFTKFHEAALSEAVEADNQDAIAKETEVLLGDTRIILASAVEANRKLKPNKRRSLEDCFALSEAFSFSSPFTEKVHVRGKKKSDGTYRPLQGFGLRHRTAQHAILRVMSAHYKPEPFQFTTRGAPAAIKRAKTLVNEGYVHAARLDIKDFFGSFTLEKLLPELPLPSEVVKNAVVGRLMEHVLEEKGKGTKAATWKYSPSGAAYQKPALSSPHATPYTHPLLSQARQGIPQGSVCAPIIGAFCISRLDWTAPGVVMLNYADDFLLLAKEKDALQGAIDALTKAVSNLPGGSHLLVVKDKKALCQGVCFLGHEMQIKGGALKVWPSYHLQDDLLGRLDSIDRRLGKLTCVSGTKHPKSDVLDLLARRHAILSGFRAAFRACDDLDRYLDMAYQSECDWLELLGVAPEEVSKFVTPDMEYTPAHY